MKDRQTYLGSTDIAAIVGLSPWATPLDVYNAKVNGHTVPDNERMKWGRALEDAILTQYAKDNGHIIGNRQVFAQHPQYEHMGGTADAVYGLEELIEVKTTSAWNTEYDEKVPDHVEIQCQWLMGLLNLTRATILVLKGGQEQKQYKINFKPKIFEHCVNEANKFWITHIVPEVPPAQTEVAAPTFEPRKEFEADEIAKSLVEDIKQLRAHNKMNEDLIKMQQEKLLSMMGDAQVLVSEGQDLAKRLEVTRETLDKKKLTAKFGDLSDCMSKSTSYQLRIS